MTLVMFVVAAVYSAMYVALAKIQQDGLETERMKAIGFSDKEIFEVFERRRLEESRNQAIRDSKPEKTSGIGIFF
jgi:hypothetical protein